MFSKILRTDYPPEDLPVLIWDGECGFCRYWVTHWSLKTQGSINYKTYQEVADHFPDIPLKEFKKASRLIEPEGTVYSGPDSAFRVFTYYKKPKRFWHNLYTRNNWFTAISDRVYNFIAKHRKLMFRLTVFFFGKNPQAIKPYWLVAILIVLVLLFLLPKYL